MKLSLARLRDLDRKIYVKIPVVHHPDRSIVAYPRTKAPPRSPYQFHVVGEAIVSSVLN
jgi:hypothetical protein